MKTGLPGGFSKHFSGQCIGDWRAGAQVLRICVNNFAKNGTLQRNPNIGRRFSGMEMFFSGVIDF